MGHQSLTVTFTLRVNRPLGPVYTKHQCQRCDNSAIMLAILLSLKTMESLQNSITTPFCRNSIVFHESSTASNIAALSQGWRWCSGWPGPYSYLSRGWKQYRCFPRRRVKLFQRREKAVTTEKIGQTERILTYAELQKKFPYLCIPVLTKGSAIMKSR